MFCSICVCQTLVQRTNIKKCLKHSTYIIKMGWYRKGAMTTKCQLGSFEIFVLVKNSKQSNKIHLLRFQQPWPTH